MLLRAVGKEYNYRAAPAATTVQYNMKKQYTDYWEGYKPGQKPEARKGRFISSEMLCLYWPLGVLIEGELRAETRLAACVRINGSDQWIPKSQIEGFCREGINFRAIVPQWLVDKTWSPRIDEQTRDRRRALADMETLEVNP